MTPANSIPPSQRSSAAQRSGQSIVFRYGIAILATAVALLIKLALGPVILPSLYVPFYGAVLVSAWVGGVGPGVASAVLSFAIGQVLFPPPNPPMPANGELAVVRDGLFLVVAIGLSWGTAALRQSQRRVAEVLQLARDELGAHVALRTAELHDTNRRLTDEMARRADAEELFRNSFEHAPIGMALVSPDGRPLQINAALCHMLGYSHDEMLRNPIAELMHPGDLATANADRARLLAGEMQSYRAERRLLHRSGTTVWVELDVSLVRDQAGRPLNLISHLHDITERKLAEQVLQESENKFRTLAETVPVATFIVQGPVTHYVNQAAVTITGYSRDELLGMPFWRFIHPEQREQVRVRALARQRGEQVPSRYEVMIVTKSGATRWVDFSAGVIDVEGTPAVLGTAFDVTERKQAEEALLRNERLLKDQAAWLQAILNSLGEAVVVADAQGKLLYFNPVAERLHGRGLTDVAPGDWSQEYGVCFPDGSPVPSDEIPLARARRGVMLTANQEFAIRPVGRDVLIPVTVTATPLVGEDGALLGGVVVYRDISNVKEAEARLRRNEARLNEAERLAHVGAWEWDLTTNTAIWSDEQFRIFGLEPGARPLSYDDFLGRLLAEDRQRVHQAVQDTLATTSSFDVECRIQRPNGEIRHVHSRGEVIRDAAGRAVRMVGTVLDITERKQFEDLLEARVDERTRELDALNERTRNILEEITAGFYSLDREGRFTYLNPSALRLFERSADQLLGKKLWEAFPEGVGSVFEEQYQRLMSEHVAVHVEAYYAARNRWFRAHGYPTHQGALVIFEDATEQHEHEVTVMSDILGALNAQLDVAKAFPAISAGLRQLTGCDRCGVTVFEDNDEWVRVLALNESQVDLQGGLRLRVADAPAARDVLEGRPSVVRDLALECDFPATRALYLHGYRSRLGVPLRGRNRTLGVLNLVWRHSDGNQQAQLPVIEQVAAMVALAVERGRLFEEVRAGRERLEALSHRLLQVQEAERQHIARELHDEIGQALTALKLSLETTAALPADSTHARLAEARYQVNELLGRVRNLALDLRPAMLDDLGLLPALLWLFERYSAQTNVQVHFEHRGLERRFDPEIETSAYRIVQEGLTNVLRHAGVHRATVRAWSDGCYLSLQVVDDGVGFDAKSALGTGVTSGLSGMRERAVLLGGHLTVESVPGRGTRVSADLPLDGRGNEARDQPAP